MYISDLKCIIAFSSIKMSSRPDPGDQAGGGAGRAAAEAICVAVDGAQVDEDQQRLRGLRPAANRHVPALGRLLRQVKNRAYLP